MRFLLALLLLLCLFLGAEAASPDQSSQKTFSLQKGVDYLAVDPFGFKPHLGNRGLLIVYTDTEEYNDGDIRYYPHTGYQILDQNGKFLQKVRNRVSLNDENPTPVVLAPGVYILETAWKITVVKLKAGCVTTTRLYAKK